MKSNKRVIYGSIVGVLLLGMIIGIGQVWKRVEPLMYIGKASMHTIDAMKEYLKEAYPVMKHFIWKERAVKHRLAIQDFAIGATDKGIIDALLSRGALSLEVQRLDEHILGEMLLTPFYGAKRTYGYYKDEDVTAIKSNQTGDVFQVVEKHFKVGAGDIKELMWPTLKVAIKELIIVEGEKASREKGERQFQLHLTEQGTKELAKAYMEWMLGAEALKESLYIAYEGEITQDELNTRLEEAKKRFNQQIDSIQIPDGINMTLIINEYQRLISGRAYLTAIEESKPVAIDIAIEQVQSQENVIGVNAQWNKVSDNKEVTGHINYESNLTRADGNRLTNLTVAHYNPSEKPMMINLRLTTVPLKNQSFSAALTANIGEKLTGSLEGNGIIIQEDDKVGIQMEDVIINLKNKLWGIELDMFNVDISYNASIQEPKGFKPAYMNPLQ